MALKDAFSFRRNDRRAIILLLLIIILSIFIYWLKQNFKIKHDKEFAEIKAEFQEQTDSINTYKEDSHFAVKLREGKTIDINSADSITLLRVPQIGSTLAHRILEYRRENGEITDLKQLKNIKGIKGKTYAKIIAYLRINTKNKSN